MSTLTELSRIGDIIKREIDPVFSRKKATIVSGAGLLSKGTVLGTITATGKLNKYDPTASSGLELVTAGKLAILGEDIDATSADTPAVVYYALFGFSTATLIWGSGVTTQNHKDAAYAGLALNHAIALPPG